MYFELLKGTFSCTNKLFNFFLKKKNLLLDLFHQENLLLYTLIDVFKWWKVLFTVYIIFIYLLLLLGVFISILYQDFSICNTLFAIVLLCRYHHGDDIHICINENCSGDQALARKCNIIEVLKKNQSCYKMTLFAMCILLVLGNKVFVLSDCVYMYIPFVKIAIFFF